jgi:hypothetical protein
MKILQFFIIPINLLQTAANKKNTHKIETKTDKADHRRKLLYLFDPGHHLGNPIEHTDAGKGQRNTIDDLNNRFVFKHRIFLVVARFFGIHDVVSTLQVYAKDSSALFPAIEPFCSSQFFW